MNEAAAEWIVRLLVAYVGLGIVFALAFVMKGAGRIDPAAREGTWGFRILIIPGTVALWPILAKRWLKGQAPPEEKNPHRRAARARAETPGGSR